MFGRFGWAEILVIVVLVLILFGHNKIPGMMKNLADGINTFKKELKVNSKKDAKKPENADNVKSADSTVKSAQKVAKKSVKAGGMSQKKSGRRVAGKKSPKK